MLDIVLQAGLDPYAKNDNDYSSSMNIIDEETGMEPEAFERFSQVCHSLVDYTDYFIFFDIIDVFSFSTKTII